MQLEQGIFNIVIGTAGHIDHGKSSLVRRLTGIDPDRLPEEQERGLTIDLGFAPYLLPDGTKTGFIDVPGHEKFIKNMVAGASGIDIAILVVAADDGVMPQTREHLQIMTLLGLQRGVIAITKCDVVDEELLELVQEDVRDLLSGTFLESAELIPVSSITGDGIETFREELHRLIESSEPKPTDGLFRMPVQRVFSAKGFGTIVTGIPLGGAAAIGDELQILPGDRRIGRVRGLQAYKNSVEKIRAGHSSAVNLSDIDYRTVHRGHVVVTPGQFAETSHVCARLQYLPDNTRPLRHMMPIRLHIGTAELLGRVQLLDARQLEPGETGLVQFRLEEPVVCDWGDHYVVRLQSPMITIGGGRVIGVEDRRFKRFDEALLADLAVRESVLDDAKERVGYVWKTVGEQPLTYAEVAQRACQTVQVVAEASADDVEASTLQEIGSGKWLHSDTVDVLIKRLAEALHLYHSEKPMRLGMTRVELRDDVGLTGPLYDYVLNQIVESGRIAKEEGSPGEPPRFRISGFEPKISEKERAALADLERIFSEGGFQTPRADDVCAQLRLSDEEYQKLHDLLRDEGVLVNVSKDIVLHRNALQQAIDLVRELGAEGKKFAAGDFRDQIGTSRKYVIPLLEYIDGIGITRRVGNERVVIERK